jgi:DNA-binding NtrC family response regulator
MFWGHSAVMQQLRSLIEKVARTDANILITGENGTGKEMLAREIHALSNRKDAPIVTVDMGAITETLFESELFGHVKGAFTDARADRPGKFEAANRGTLFLDEIGNLPFHLQAKLLTALQSRSIVRVGSNAPVPVDIRLISATNKDLRQMVDKALFREDLLYRINTIHVEIPPLRERPEDIVPLAEIFLARYANAYGKQALRLSNSAKEKLKAQPWFGNIRELQHTLEKTVIISEGNALEAGHFDFPYRKEAPALKETATLEEMEYNMIKNAMDKHNGNLSLVAAQLGISRQTLYNKMKRYEL